MPKLLFVTSEVTPLIMTGGLADVSASLPVALKALRWAVRLLMPAYPEALAKAAPTKLIAQLKIPATPGEVKLLEGRLPDTNLPVWLVDYAPAFERPGNPYTQDNGHDWPDNAERFALLSRCAVEIAQGRAGLSWVPDIVHCNDWQTGLTPALLSVESRRPATVFTVHNLAYQGRFPARTFDSLKLPKTLWSLEGLEFYGELSFIKGGLAFADHITTVSPSYAEEIQTAQFGYRLEGLLRYRHPVLTGILNGIDDVTWNPATDPHIVQTYTADTLQKKSRNKIALLKDFNLPVHPSAHNKRRLLLGSVGRLVEQKGIDLLLKIIGRLAALEVQCILLGSGEKRIEKALRSAAQRYPNTLAVHIGYDERLAHRIKAGADAFLMPSHFEPCGLSQLYSLRYGTPPIVHAVGGLKDTVVDSSGATLEAGTATGFSFSPATPETLLTSIERAVTLHAQSRQWNSLCKTGMAQCFNWHASAQRYAQLYRDLLRAGKR